MLKTKDLRRKSDRLLERSQFEEDFESPVLTLIDRSPDSHFFWDDCDKLKLTEFKYQEIFSLIDTIYRKQLGISLTSNLELGDLARSERLPQAAVSRIDRMCRVILL